MILLRYFAAMIGIVMVCYIFPLFHVHNLEDIKRMQKMETFDPNNFVTEFWNNELIQSFDKAVPIQTLLSLIEQEPQSAKNEYAKTVGIGSVYYYFLQGKGFVKSIHENHIAVVIERESQNPDLFIKTGKIFGNAVRNGTGLIDVSDFPNSQIFNQISTHLNKMVENEVLPFFISNVKTGDYISFVGCCEILNEKNDLHPLTLIPISVNVE